MDNSNVGWLLQPGDGPGYDESKWVASHELEASQAASDFLAGLHEQVEETHREQ